MLAGSLAVAAAIASAAVVTEMVAVGIVVEAVGKVPASVVAGRNFPPS